MYIWKYTYLILPLYIKKRYDIDYIKSRIKFLSNLPLRQGGKKDVVNQQLKELKMKKLNLFVVRPSDSKEEVQKKLTEYLKQQGIKVVKEGKHGK